MPGASINILLDDNLWATVTTGLAGAYSISINSSDLTIGTHSIQAVSETLTATATLSVSPQEPLTREDILTMALGFAFPISIIVIVKVIGDWPPAWVQDIQRRMRVRIK